ncbi:MAG: discoidin domain-containing protein [Solirubrobacterales bacterium]|nr:discoidin domain-containing protein [Solirubrobacterales bacterium]
MTRPRILAAVLATLVVALPAAPARAQTKLTGLSGSVVDGDSGLPVQGANVAFHAAGDPGQPIAAVTDATGRYIITGVPADSTGRLVVGGPGWTPTSVEGLTLPVAEQDVELRRDWAATGGGARVTAATDEGAAGCEPGRLVDGDRTTAWSAGAGAAPASPDAVTVELAAPVDVDRFQLTAGAGCGHADGAALGRYRIETSPDGVTWTTAREGELGPDDRGRAAALEPTGGATGVRFARLVLLGAQDPASPTIDVRALEVQGKGPNVAPSGTLTPNDARPVAGLPVRLLAQFTDPDSTIVRMLWDFQSDGTWDQATLGPVVSHVYAGVGRYRVTVGARDFRGALGTATTDLEVKAPGQTAEPLLNRRPLIGVGEPDGPGVDFRVYCAAACRVRARMIISEQLRVAVGLRRRTIRTMNRVAKPGALANWTIEVGSRTLRRIVDSGRDRLGVVIEVKAWDAAGRRAQTRRRFTLE